MSIVGSHNQRGEAASHIELASFVSLLPESGERDMALSGSAVDAKGQEKHTSCR